MKLPNEKKYNLNNNSSSVTNYESILREDKKAKHKTRKRNSAAFDIAKIIKNKNKQKLPYRYTDSNLVDKFI